MKVIGIMTKDFKLLYELITLMKAQKQTFVTLDFKDPIPENVGVIITSRAEKHDVRFRTLVANDDPEMAFKMAKSLLSGGENFDTLVVGVDPGARPGVALLGDGRVLISETVGSPERVADEVDRLLRTFAHHRLIARVGHGDRTNRNRIIRAIWNSVDDVEVVDEKNTTRRTDEPDADAAVTIALSVGYRMPFPPEVAPTPGEIRDIQRISRIESGGRMTISFELADQVARGELTLPEALTAQGRRSSR